MGPADRYVSAAADQEQTEASFLSSAMQRCETCNSESDFSCVALTLFDMQNMERGFMAGRCRRMRVPWFQSLTELDGQQIVWGRDVWLDACGVSITVG